MRKRSSRWPFTLWYRPIQAIKFGVQYEYAMARYSNASAGTCVQRLSCD